MPELPNPTPWCHQVLKPDGTVTHYPPAGIHYTLEELQKAVEGFIQVVPLRGGCVPHVMVIDEEGKLKGLTLNRIATSLYDGFPDFIVGNALVCRDTDID